MELPKVTKKKLINKKEFVKLAKKVHKIFEEEDRYVFEKKIKYGNNLSSHASSNS
jgi:hypothetical protein